MRSFFGSSTFAAKDALSSSGSGFAPAWGSYPLSTASLLSERYAFKNDEKPFVRELLRRKRNLWAFRCDQRRFAGDFVVVDMSEPRPERRWVVVLDLKMGAPFRRARVPVRGTARGAVKIRR